MTITGRDGQMRVWAFLLWRQLSLYYFHGVRQSPNKSRGCVKSADMKFGNDQIFAVRHFDGSGRWMGWSKNEFSHSLSPEPTAVGACRSAVAVHVASRRWLS